MKTNTAKKLSPAARKLAALKATKRLAKMLKEEPKTSKKASTKNVKHAKHAPAKVIDLKARLGKKETNTTKSLFTNDKEREKYARYGIEALAVEDGGYEVRIDKDLSQITLADEDVATELAVNLFTHLKAQSEKLLKLTLRDLLDEAEGNKPVVRFLKSAIAERS
jgi:hypothetical protein